MPALGAGTQCGEHGVRAVRRDEQAQAARARRVQRCQAPGGQGDPGLIADGQRGLVDAQGQPAGGGGQAQGLREAAGSDGAGVVEAVADLAQEAREGAQSLGTWCS